MTALHVSFGHARALPIDVLLSAIPSLPRQALDRLVERAIERMDEQDGDADVELNGDERDGSACAEDEFWPHFLDHGYQPGCPVSDPGEPNHDDEEDQHHA